MIAVFPWFTDDQADDLIEIGSSDEDLKVVHYVVCLIEYSLQT